MLEGLTVVELATYIAGPGAGAILADWGADVIKVESPAGDPARQFLIDDPSGGGHNPMFALDNRGKRSIVLDYGRPEGREALERLIARADILLTNVRPGALKRANLDAAAVQARHPRLIYCSITGYGLEGPDADRAGFDVAAFWARAGVGAITRPKGTEPFPIRTGMGDHVCSLTAVSGILAALVERNRTGVGRLVEASLLRAGVYAISSDMAVQLHYGKLATTKSRHQSLNPLANFFRTADDRWICLVPRTGKGGDFPQACRALGVCELLDDTRFATSRGRREHTTELVTALDAAFATLTFDEAAERLDEEDLVWAPLQTPGEVTADPQAAAAGCFVETPDGRGGRFRTPAGPVRFPGADDGPKGPVPAIGEHTEAVLRDLGYDDAGVGAIRGVDLA